MNKVLIIKRRKRYDINNGPYNSLDLIIVNNNRVMEIKNTGVNTRMFKMFMNGLIYTNLDKIKKSIRSEEIEILNDFKAKAILNEYFKGDTNE